MSEQRIIIKKKDPIQYVRFGTCWNCGTKIAVIGTRWEIEDYIRIKCECCNSSNAIPLGFLHKTDGWYAKRKLKGVKINESKNKY